MRKTTKGTKGNGKGSFSALFSQEEKLGRKDSLLEKGMRHQNTTQRKQKCLKSVLRLQSLRRITPVTGVGDGNLRQGATDG